MKDGRIDFLQELLDQALRAGADAGDATIGVARSNSVQARNGELEKSTRSESTSINLRVIVGQRVSSVSCNESSPDVIQGLVERAIATAKMSPKDPFAMLVPAEEIANVPNTDYDVRDDTQVTTEKLLETALEMDAAVAAVEGVRQCLGAGAGAGENYSAVCTSNGFINERVSTSFGRGCGALAADADGMESDNESCSKAHCEDLRDTAAIGSLAGERAVARLGGRKMQSGQFPTVYSPRTSNSLLDHFMSAVNGNSVKMGMSFLRESMDQAVFGGGINIIDDPHMRRRFSSASCDGEGTATRKIEFIDDGRLTSWLLNYSVAQQLGLQSTGHGGSHGGGPGGGYNPHVAAGTMTPDELISDIKTGFYVTHLFGQGVNAITGDYSRGASGFIIENGVIGHPVKEVTIAGNLKDMFMNVIPADDLEFRFGSNAPTLRVDGMMIAGG